MFTVCELARVVTFELGERVRSRPMATKPAPDAYGDWISPDRAVRVTRIDDGAQYWFVVQVDGTEIDETFSTFDDAVAAGAEIVTR